MPPEKENIMPGITKESFYNEQKNHTIYAILDDLNHNVYVWQTSNPDLKDVYEKHYFGKIAGTKAMFETGKAVGKPPKMYRLEEVFDTGAMVYRHCLAWTKYFMTYEYTNQNRRFPAGYLSVLIPETQEIYDRIKDLWFHEVTSDELFANYGHRRKKPNPGATGRRHISIVLNREEYEALDAKAKEQNMKRSAFVKKRVLEGKIRCFNFEELRPINARVKELEDQIGEIKYTTYVTERFYPSDMEKIKAIVSEILQLHEEAMDVMDKERRRAGHKVPKRRGRGGKRHEK